MNINYLIALLGVTSIYLIIIFWLLNKGMLSGSDSNFKNIVSIVALIANILVVVGFFVTFMLFHQEQKVTTQRLEDAYNARIETLKKEIAVNIGISDEILKMEDDTTSLPESKFEFAILENFLKSGDIKNEKLTNAWNSYRTMKTANNLLEKALAVLYYEHIADPRDKLSSSGRRTRILDLKKNAIKYTKEAKKLLEELQSDY